MRGKKVKKLRKSVYGDYSPRIREYVKTSEGQIINVAQKRNFCLKDGTMVELPDRKIFRLLKREYSRGGR